MSQLAGGISIGGGMGMKRRSSRWDTPKEKCTRLVEDWRVDEGINISDDEALQLARSIAEFTGGEIAWLLERLRQEPELREKLGLACDCEYFPSCIGDR